MAIQNNKRVLHRKEWQMMTPAPTASAAGGFIIKDPLGLRKTALYIASATVHHLYATDEDGWLQIPSMALAGAFGAGACGTWGCWSNILTANGGSTASVTTATAITSRMLGEKIRFLTGSQAGKEATITGCKIVVGGTSTITFSPALSGAVVNTDTFTTSTGRYYILNAGTVAAGIFKSFDPSTGVVTTLGTSGLPASLGTDCKLVATPSYVGAFASGVATSATSTTITNSNKTWAVNQWCNSQVRITSGTGIGQVRTIATNTATALTITAAWTITPDATSNYAIEGNDDFLYLIGNNAVTMYRYSLTSNTWATLAPTTARAAAMVAGGGANWVSKTGNVDWQDESNILDGRYIYSFRGGGSSVLDRFDIAGGTAGAGAWLAITYMNAQETFTTGSSYDVDGENIYIKKDATNRMFYYKIVGNYLYPLNTDLFPDSTAVIGDKMFTVSYFDGTGDTITWLYYLQNTGTALRRMMLY